MDQSTYIYVIDDLDQIETESPNWDAFANANGVEGSASARELGRSIWDFIAGEETKLLYQTIFEKVRAGRSLPPIPFRCDAPDARRFLEISLDPLGGGRIRILSTLLKTEPRPSVRALDTTVPRAEGVVRICSVCKRVAVREGAWAELEEAISTLHLFDDALPPRLSHSLCPDCFQSVMKALDAEEDGEAGGGV